LEVGGEAESEYVAEETTMMSTANAHFALEGVRDAAVQERDAGPRVLVVGPENSGKTSLVRILTGYAVKCGRQPVVVNLDPRQGMLSVPGSFSAAAFSSIVDVEEGWGSSPISGPSPIPVKMPLVYHYGMGNPETEDGRVFRPLVTRMALAVTSRLEEDTASKQAGLIIDSPGSMAQGKNGSYENIEHIVSEFSGACPHFIHFAYLSIYPFTLTPNSKRPLCPRQRTPVLRPLTPPIQPPRFRNLPRNPPRQIRRLRRPHRRLHESPAPIPDRGIRRLEYLQSHQ
jgi:energy-coupling factor transporter ATP-binding protein EcfA2